jgi:hypothetical protein
MTSENDDPIRFGIMSILVGGTILCVLLFAPEIASDIYIGNANSALFFAKIATEIELSLIATVLLLFLVFRK